MKVFIDTETCGLEGPIVIIQYAYEDKEPIIHEAWTTPIEQTLDVIRQINNNDIIGFNLVFDWFHICKLYTTLQVLGERVGFDKEPRDYINEYADCEPIARDGPCLKPNGCFDLYLHARKGPYQVTMDRRPIRIPYVPNLILDEVINELNCRLDFPDYLFARKKKDKDEVWKVFSTNNPDCSDIVCRFNASSGLKVLCLDAGLIDKNRVLLKDIEGPIPPLELPYAPFALALSNKDKEWRCFKGGKKGWAWPGVIKEHYYHWRYHEKAKEYAINDVIDTRNLYKHFNSPDINDDDSILACMCGSIRWKGFTLNLDLIKQLKEKEQFKIRDIPTAPTRVEPYLKKVLTKEEIEVNSKDGKFSTKKVVLETLSKWKDHPVAERAANVLEARRAHFKIKLFEKLEVAGRFHPSVSIIGSLSNRMSGSTESKEGEKQANLNALGIPNDKDIRKAFTLYHSGMTLCGGDFDAFEVAIADAICDDSELRKELLTCHICNYVCSLDEYQNSICPNCNNKDSRKKIHGLFAQYLYPNETYDSILASKGTPFDMYKYGKNCFFGGILYGGDENTMVNKYGIELENAINARNNFFDRFEGVKKEIIINEKAYKSLRQTGGIGTKFTYYKPQDYAESLVGFKRYFPIENKVVKIFYDLATNPPKHWYKYKQRVIRREKRGIQKTFGATLSALFNAACTLQGNVMRAALNHKNQSTGASITKGLQVAIWQHQPKGIHEWFVMPQNIHDEVMCPVKKGHENAIKNTVDNYVKSKRNIIPLLKLGWNIDLPNWGER